MVVVRGLKMNLPPVIGDIEPIKASKEPLLAGKLCTLILIGSCSAISRLTYAC